MLLWQPLPAWVALTALPAQSVPLPQQRSARRTRRHPLIELAAQGCGNSYRRTRWQDRWGYWLLALGPLRSEVVGEGSISANGLVEPAKTDGIELSDATAGRAAVKSDTGIRAVFSFCQ